MNQQFTKKKQTEQQDTSQDKVKSSLSTRISKHPLVQLQQTIGNHGVLQRYSTPSERTEKEQKEVPPIVHEVLQSPGQPLNPATRAFFESRFGHDFSQVRVHTDRRASAAARSISALAFAWGDQVVIQPSMLARQDGSRLLAHELAHVVQAGGAARTHPPGLVPTHSSAEAEADSAAQAALNGCNFRLSPIAGPPPLFLARDTRLGHFLETFSRKGHEYADASTDEERVRRILLHFSGVDLGDADNMGPVSDAVSRLMPESTLFLFLETVETDPSVRRIASEELRMQRTIALMQVRRTPFGGYTPLPMTELMTGAGRQVSQGMSQLASSSFAFFSGLIEGMGGPGSDALVANLQRRLASSSVLTIVTPSVFSAGALVGIGEDLWRAIRGVWELVTNFSAMFEQFRQLFTLLVSPTGPALTRVMGRHVGSNWRTDLVRLANYSVFRFTYEVGRIIGPTIVYAVLAILGIGAAGIAGEALSGFIQIFRRFPVVMRTIERIGRFFRRRPRGPLAGVTEREIETALEHIETPRITGRARPRIGDRPVPTRRVPRLDVQDIPLLRGERLPDAIRRIRGIIGRRLSDYPEIQAAWNRAAATARRGQTLSQQNARQLYDMARSLFWEEVRSDPTAMRRFAHAGFAFPDEARRAAKLGGVGPHVPPQEITVSLDHIAEIAQGNNWARALDSANLRFEFAAPNSFREIIQMRHPRLRHVD